MLIRYSHRPHAHLRRIFHLSPAFQPCSLTDQGLGITIDHLHDRVWPRTHCSLRNMGALLRAQVLLPIPPHERSISRCSMLSRRQLLDRFLVSAPTILF